MSRVLLLNASYEPIHVIPVNRAVILILQEKADIVEEDTKGMIRSENLTLPLPTVIRLRYFVQIPWHARVPLNRRNLAVRDNGLCGYCGNKGNTIDHIVPRSRGGLHRWDNVTLACAPCNSRKDDKLLSEMGWRLLSDPQVPISRSHMIVGIARVDPTWETHLAQYI